MLSRLVFFSLLSFINCNPIYQEKKRCKEIENTNMIIPDKELKASLKKKNMLIDVKFFVIHDNEKGKITRYRLNKQIDALNDAYGGNQHNQGINTKIKFRLKNVQYIEDKTLYNSCGKSEEKIIKSYPGDSKKYISVYTCDDDYLGYAYYPWHEKEGDIEQVVFMNEMAITGSRFKLYNMGMTLVHELGHYFGLPHTFNENRKCSNNGDDGYSDTPIEKTPNYGCNINRDTCPDHPGKDPIWNYMDYSPDSCMNRFSQKQVNDIIYNIDNYRPKLKQRSINNYKKTTTTLKTTKTTTTTTTKTTKTKTTTTNTLETTNTRTTLTTTKKSFYKICERKNKKSCNKSDKCYWHDHYIKCYPNTHQDTDKIFCDVRSDKDKKKKSKYKCKSEKYRKKCIWNDKKKKCIPK